MQARLVLVHSPLVGCGTWEPVARDLAGAGYAVTVPDLAGTVAAGPPYHLRQARVIADSAADQPAILIGHSRAGPLLATAGTMLGEGVRGYIFVDARLPAPERSWMETVPPDLAARLREMTDPQGRLPPWSQWWGEEELAALLPDPAVRQHFAAGCPRLPLALLEEVHPPAPGWPNASGGYLQLSEAYEDEAARARELGWPVRQQLSHHLALLTEPEQVAREVRRLCGGDSGRRPGRGRAGAVDERTGRLLPDQSGDRGQGHQPARR
jgi:pimeloyl-ACP methyl ester carboxylesterase